LGLFILVINAGIVLLASEIVDGFEVKSFWWALLFSVINSLVSTLLEQKDKQHEK
jgi:putative membrane protein